MSMDSLWLLAEMSVTSQHGSGVTLMRTLGSELEDFQGMVGLYDEHKFDPRFANRAHAWLPFTCSNSCRAILGCRLSYWLTFLPAFENFYASQCARRLDKILSVDGKSHHFLVCPHQSFTIRTIEKLQKIRSFRYVTWIMDDNWVMQDNTMSWRYNPKMESLLRSHLRGAEAVVTISQQMGEHLQKSFGVKFEVLFAPSPYENVFLPAEFLAARKLAYFGTLSAWPGDALSRLIPLLPELDYTLDIYSHHELPSNLRHPRVVKMPPLAPDRVQEIMKQYDAVLIPIGFTSATASYTHFNIATKMAECLGSGTVTLAIGPEDAAMMRYFQTHDVGLRASDVTVAGLAPAFQVIQSQQLRCHRIEKDLAHVRSHLAKPMVRRRWESIRDRLLNPK